MIQISFEAFNFFFLGYKIYISNVAEVMKNVFKEIILWRVRIFYNIHAMSSEDEMMVRNTVYDATLGFIIFITINYIPVLRI